METISKLSVVYHLNVCLWLATFTRGVTHSQCDNGGFGSDQVDQDVQNCTAPLCLPDSQCSLHSAFIQSPNYPKPYPAKQDVYWFLKLTKNTSVDAVVIRVEDFHLEKDHDWVNIGIRNHLDSSTVQESLTGILRRGKTVRVPFSFGFQVYVHFHSDNTIQLKGFRFRYTVVPKEPRRVQVVKLTPTAVLLRWDPLVTKAQRNVTYKVYHGPYGEQTTLAGARLVTGKAEYNLTGLMASTSYFAYVVALMNCGQEDIGCLVNFTTTSYSLGETLHPRVELSTIEVECDTVFVSWNSPQAVGSSVIGYRVRIMTDAGMEVKATQVRYVTLRNLRADQDYNITVTVVNGQGEGPPSNQVKIRLPRCRPGETAPSMTPVLAQELRYRVRSSSLLIQLPSCTLLGRIAGQLRQNLSVWMLLVEDTAGVVLPSEMVPDDWNATYSHTDIGRRGVHLVHRHLPCYPTTAKSDPLTDFGIFQVGGEETCSPTWTCNGPLRSNTTYRLCYVLVSDGSPILFSQWSEPFTTRTVVQYEDLGDGVRSLSPAAVTASLLLTTLCLLLLLGLLGVAYRRQRWTDGRSLVWRSFALRHLNPVQLSGLGTRLEEVTADSTSPGSAGETPQH